MAVNIDPIFVLTPTSPVGQTLSTANTAKDGTGTVVTLATAGTYGQKIKRIVIQPTGTSVKTVVRLFINNGSTNATAGNNTYIKDIAVPANTIVENDVMPNIELDVDIDLPPSYKLNATIGTTVAAALAITAFGGDF